MVNVLYIVLGCIVILIPGFLLSLLFYPKRKDLDFWERVGVSFGFGVLTAVFVAFAVAQPDLKMLRAVPYFSSLFALSAIFAIIAYWRGSLKWVIALFWRPKPKPEEPPPERPPEQPPPEQPPAQEPAPVSPPSEQPTLERPSEEEQKAEEEAKSGS